MGTMVFFLNVGKACATACTPEERRAFFDYIQQILGLKPGPNHMIPAQDLTIHDPKHKQCWELKKGFFLNSFKETKLLKPDCQSWEIKASITFDLLLYEKEYRVYLIFKTTNESQGLEAVLTATVSTEIREGQKDVCLSSNPEADADQTSSDINLPVRSSYYKDWMELELGWFYCTESIFKRKAEISIKVKESGNHQMGGFYVAGIQLRS